MEAPDRDRRVRKLGPKLIPALKVAFLDHELSSADTRRQKVALQELAGLCRGRHILGPSDKYRFEVLINGLVSTSPDYKVVRWALNCLAQIGTMTYSSASVGLALKRYESSPEIVAAAVAALSKLYNGELTACDALKSVDPVIKTLAAMQNTDHAKLDLAGLKIDIEKADLEVLKLALITVGLNRSVENMFHPKHRNGELVRELGQHEDSIVRQYSVWSVIENRTLTISDLGIPFDTLEVQPVNVQSKLLQLGAEQIEDLRQRQELIRVGTYLPHDDAREGLAKGVLHIYYDGLEEVTVGWFDAEANARIRGLLAEHFARQWRGTGVYEDKAIEIYSSDRSLRERLLVGAEGTKLYSLLQSSDGQNGMGSLFGYEDDLLGLAIEARKRKVQMKVLMMMASPKKQTPLRLDQEARDMAEQLALVKDAAVQVEVSHAWAVRVRDIQVAVLNTNPKVLHFSGHGTQGALCFEDDQGLVQLVDASPFAEFVSLFPALECVVLNACYSDSVAKAATKHIQAVVGCDVSIGDEAAIKFSMAFYRALAHGKTYEQAFAFAKNDLNLAGLQKEAAKYHLTLRQG